MHGCSSACWSWQRGPWHLSYSGSLVRGGPEAPGKAELHSHLYFELQALFQHEGKQQQTEAWLSLLKDNCRERRTRVARQGGENWQGETHGKTRNETFLTPLFPDMSMAQGMKRNFDPGPVPSLGFPSTKFSRVRTNCLF